MFGIQVILLSAYYEASICICALINLHFVLSVPIFALRTQCMVMYYCREHLELYKKLGKLAQALTLLTCIVEVPGLNVGQDTDNFE